MIEVRHLRSLVAIAESGKLATAAERVHVSQSALSHQIKAIESHYGLPLFDRTRQGLRFTPAGERLLALAREVLAAVSAADRDIERLKGDTRGELRVVLECHTCFDWLMPVMDEFRRRWPEVEVDLVAGFHADPIALLRNGRADMVIGSQPAARRGLEVAPLFRFEILAVIANEHRLRNKRRIEAADLAGETLITYPVPESRIDLIREVLEPAGIHLERRTAELTVAVLQLVASRRGVAALPNWGVKNYVDHDYVLAKRIGAKGLWSELYATVPSAMARRPYVADFVAIVRDTCAAQLDGIELLAPAA
ncbi:transcriptional regulator of methionine biosynthesis (LysR family) [Cupriavidus taiwanensis]|uniref:HTH-type transcriptional regulator MetR n=1 Tax=Cupriavidus taiwanensis TaxID=164546 RepID=A0A375E9P8_9BURK|nr:MULTISPECIES: LysR family transcriptional regulator [Cupriavidus]MBB2917569.1 LysR family transcriptional regulator for metE and metH [Cupriavidus alkaliphilus]PVY71020.1 LysR family transcriptional regulator [Cupriavidus alkaliphilus]RAS03044.1 LysR family transcriptional regulator [Cupriavidus alkaliphilus]SOZ17877.1 transcriptional regulator of methionine biosynthesis (LysR family) [Cupriavidus taiwanensis]SOZ30463.1 transcriptional regulator of methionine biosynthesis (LysR family) [Cup